MQRLIIPILIEKPNKMKKAVFLTLFVLLYAVLSYTPKSGIVLAKQKTRDTVLARYEPPQLMNDSNFVTFDIDLF